MVSSVVCSSANREAVRGAAALARGPRARLGGGNTPADVGFGRRTGARAAGEGRRAAPGGQRTGEEAAAYRKRKIDRGLYVLEGQIGPYVRVQDSYALQVGLKC